jgi:NAD-dependent SIR2 family protein deacetylase
MDVYVFGAGASAPYGAPTMNDFLSKAFNLWVFNTPGAASFEDELRMVAGAIDNLNGTNLSKAWDGDKNLAPEDTVALTKINVEELLAWAEENNDSQLRQALDRVIYKTLELSINSGREGEYERLLAKILKAGNKVCLISFNYDFLLDLALGEKARTPKIGWTYCVPFNAGVINSPYYQPSADPQIYLLKLHGSLRWLQCLGCGSLQLRYHMTYDHITSTTWPSCNSCESSSGSFIGFKPVLVAPTPVKYFPDALKVAWFSAAECLKKAEKLTVIGYSFPAFDQTARNLFLKNVIVPNLLANRRPKLTIVERSECVREAISSWFLPAVDTVIEEHSSFEAYCADQE